MTTEIFYDTYVLPVVDVIFAALSLKCYFIRGKRKKDKKKKKKKRLM